MDQQRNLPATTIFDPDGFLIDPETWNETVADQIAVTDGLGQLSELQLGVLHVLREEFARHGTVTALSHVCHQKGLDPDCMHHLFPSPREAWRIAGLPNPGEEAKAYL